MKKTVLSLIVVFVLASSANAWNDKGHMVVARLAWRKLKANERAAIIKLLASHPHLDEFLKAKKPANMTQDEWVFLRAATWADWVRSGPSQRRAFSKPERHFVNLPFVDPDSTVKPPSALPKVNVIQSIEEMKLQATAGGDQVKRAVAITWLLHLVGDIHQPLHCATYYNEDFPEGDRGGTRARVRIDGRSVQLHSFWDGLLGRDTTLSSISNTVLEIEKMVQGGSDALKADLAANKTPKSWADEGLELAKKYAYLNGKLKPANEDDHPHGEAIPTVPNGYAQQAGETARYCVAKAGERLAQVLREVIAKNE
jgi:hypothetical protein